MRLVSNLFRAPFKWNNSFLKNNLNKNYRLNLVNALSIIVTLSSFVYMCFAYVQRLEFLVYVHLAIVVIGCVTVLLNRKGQYLFARNLLLIAINVNILLVSQYLGKSSQVHLFLFPISIVPFVIFSFKEKFYFLLFPTISFLIYLAIEFNHPVLSLLNLPGKIVSDNLMYIYYLPAILFNIFGILILKITNEDMLSSMEVTASLEKNKLLRQKNRDIENIFESANAMIFLLDNLGKIKNLNSLAIKFTAISASKEFFIGKTFAEIFSKEMSTKLHLENLEVIQSKKSRLGTVEEIDQFITIDIDRIINFDEDENVVGLGIYIKDYTGYKIAEDRIRMLTSVVVNTRDAVLISEAEPIDPPGPKIIYVNKAFTDMTGYTLQEVMDKTPRILQGVNSSRKELDKIRHALENWKSVKVELINYTKAGKEFWSELEITPIANESGKYTHWISIQRDISERKKVELELINAKENAERATRHKSQFLANMSHEIRTPLNAVIGFTEEMLFNEEDSEKKKILGIIKSSGDTLLKLLNDILDIGKVEEGKLEISPIDFHFNEIIYSTIMPYKLKANEKGNEFIIQIADDIPEYVNADPYRLRQILINLIGNSIKFTSNGMINVKIELIEKKDDDAILKFTVSDTGIGIPADKQEIIFESFAQADNSTTRKYGGTGLGLTIARNLTFLMGGKIGVISPSEKNDNKKFPGTDFWFTIKVKLAESKIESEKKSEIGNVLFIKFIKILVVEDNPVNQILMETLLSKLNCEYTLAENGEIAIEKFKEEKFDIILMDLQMPVMDGLTATRIIRDISGNKQIPIIALSANAFKEDIEVSIQAGMNSFITKPFKIKELLEVINKLLK